MSLLLGVSEWFVGELPERLLVLGLLQAVGARGLSLMSLGLLGLSPGLVVSLGASS